MGNAVIETKDIFEAAFASLCQRQTFYQSHVFHVIINTTSKAINVPFVIKMALTPTITDKYGLVFCIGLVTQLNFYSTFSSVELMCKIIQMMKDYK